MRAKCARVVDTWSEWSEALNITLVSESNVTLNVAGAGISYCVAVRVRLIDVKSRIVVFMAGHRVTNMSLSMLQLDVPCGPLRNALTLRLASGADLPLSIVAPFVLVSLTSSDGRTRLSSAEPFLLAERKQTHGDGSNNDSFNGANGGSSSSSSSSAGGNDGGDDSATSDDNGGLAGGAVPLLLHRLDTASSAVVVVSVTVHGDVVTTVQLGDWQRAAPFACANRTAHALRLRWTPSALPSPRSYLAQTYRRVNSGVGIAGGDAGNSTRRRARTHWHATICVQPNAVVDLYPPPV